MNYNAPFKDVLRYKIIKSVQSLLFQWHFNPALRLHNSLLFYQPFVFITHTVCLNGYSPVLKATVLYSDCLYGYLYYSSMQGAISLYPIV